MRWLWLAAAWFVAIAVAGEAGVFVTGDRPPVALGLAVVLPPAIVGALLAWSQPFRAWAGRADLHLLTMLQMWRIIGFAFVALWAVGRLPGGFALPAGLGDILVGLTAPLVAARWLGSKGLFYGWTALGVGDLVVAVVLGVLYSPSRLGILATTPDMSVMAQLPMILVPAFAVPAALALHVVSLWRFASERRAAQGLAHAERPGRRP